MPAVGSDCDREMDDWCGLAGAAALSCGLFMPKARRAASRARVRIFIRKGKVNDNPDTVAQILGQYVISMT
jgi:hypothetical protein